MPGTDTYLGTGDGDALCAESFDSYLFVPNSKDESAFIGNYLASIKAGLVSFSKLKYVLLNVITLGQASLENNN